MNSALIKAAINLARAVNGMAKCPDHRTVASLDAADLITVGDMRAILEHLQGMPATLPATGETKT